MSNTILVLEHKSENRLSLQEHLSRQGFEVTLADNSHEGLSLAFEVSPKLILLDLMLPSRTGYQFLRTYRRRRNTPIITMTKKLEESEVLRAFSLGADDVVSKPVRLRELVARIEALLHRSQQVINRLEVGEIVLDCVQGTVTVGGAIVKLTPSEFHLLAHLMSHAGVTVPHATLLEPLLAEGYRCSKGSLKVHIRNLRQKLEPDASSPTYIKTVFGVGYRFCGSYSNPK